MQEEAAQELDSVKRHDARLIAVRIVAPPESDVLFIESQQAMIEMATRCV
jgi:hypothetical protein